MICCDCQLIQPDNATNMNCHIWTLLRMILTNRSLIIPARAPLEL